jgi:hypothetical protein
MADNLQRLGAFLGNDFHPSAIGKRGRKINQVPIDPAGNGSLGKTGSD